MDTTTLALENENLSNLNGEGSFLEMLEQYDFPYPRRGEIVNGKILYKGDDVVYIDVGSKRDAVLPHEEVTGAAASWLKGVSIGDEIPVYIVNSPSGGDQLIVSVERVLREQDWDRALACQESDKLIELKVVGYNKGGLMVEFGALRGFVPNSHVPELRHVQDEQDLISAKARLVGTLKPFKVLDIDQANQRLVLSGTAVEKELAIKQFQQLEEGQKVTGKVTNLKKYGAFLDLGYISGLLHISEMSWTSISHPSEILSVGDEIEVVISNVDVENERISLSRRPLLPSPVAKFAETNEIGGLLEGTVTNIRDFGAFIVLEDGIEGLVHISEMDLAYGGHPTDALHSGDKVLVRIINIDAKEGRISLSLKKVSAEEQIAWMQRSPEREQEADAELEDAPVLEATSVVEEVQEEAQEEVETQEETA